MGQESTDVFPAFDNPLDIDLTEEDEGIHVRDLAKFGTGVTKFGKGGLQSGLKMATSIGRGDLVGMMGQVARGAAISDEDLKALFDAVDDDNSGELDGLEMRQLIESLGVVLTDAEFAETIAEVVSPNETDVTIAVSEVAITFDQFATWWRQQTDAQGSSSRFAKLLRGEEEAISMRGTTEQLLRTTWFDPFGHFKRIWESVVIIILLYVGVTLPYRIAFEAIAVGGYYYVAVFYELALISDVLINMRTAYWDENNSEMVTGSFAMARYYVFKKVGWMDIISSFPFQTLKLDANPNLSSNMKTLQLLRLCQVVRIVKVIRAVTAMQDAFFKIVNDTLGSLSVSVSVYTMKMTKLITLLVTVAHLCSCIWYILGKPGETVSFGISLDVMDLGVSSNDDADNGWVMRNYPDHKDDKLFLYLHSFYFVQTTMSTVGYGDVLPVRTSEVFFAMIVQVLGTGIFGYVVGLMGTSVSGLAAHENPMHIKIEFMEALMDKYKIKKDVRMRVRRQLKSDLEAAQRYMIESVLGEFPRDLRRDVTLSVFRKATTSFELVAGYPGRYIAEVLSLMKPYAMVKGEVLYKLNTPADEIFFIDDGSVTMKWEDVRIPQKQRPQHDVATIGEGCCFGDEGLLADASADVPDHVFMAVVRQPGNLFFVRQNSLAKLLHAHPEVKQITQKAIRSKLNRWQRATIASLQGKFDDESEGTRDPDAELSPYLYEPAGALPMPNFSGTGRIGQEDDTETAAALQDGPREDEPARDPRFDELRADIAQMKQQLQVLMDKLVLR